MSLLYVLLLLVIVGLLVFGSFRVWEWRRGRHSPSQVPTDEVAERLVRVTERLEESSERLAQQIDLYVADGLDSEHQRQG